MCLLCTSRRAIFNLSDPFQAPGLLITGSTRQRAHASTLFNVCNYVLGMLFFVVLFLFHWKCDDAFALVPSSQSQYEY